MRWGMATVLADIQDQDNQFGVLRALYHTAELQAFRHHVVPVLPELLSGLQGNIQDVPHAVVEVPSAVSMREVTIQRI